MITEDPSRRWGDAAAWDRIWSSHPYGNPRLRALRARSKIAAAVHLGLELEDSDCLLDPACGSGETLIEAAKRVSRQARFVGSDISGTALSRARANVRRAGLDATLVRADWSRLPFRAGSFKKIFVFSPPRPFRWQEINRTLAPGGQVFLIVPTRDSVISLWYRIRERVRRDVFDEAGNRSAEQLVSEAEEHFVVESWRVWHSGSDRRYSGTVDRIIASVIPNWGRYVALRCRKSAM